MNFKKIKDSYVNLDTVTKITISLQSDQSTEYQVYQKDSQVLVTSYAYAYGHSVWKLHKVDYDATLLQRSLEQLEAYNTAYLELWDSKQHTPIMDSLRDMPFTTCKEYTTTAYAILHTTDGTTESIEITTQKQEYTPLFTEQVSSVDTVQLEKQAHDYIQSIIGTTPVELIQ